VAASILQLVPIEIPHPGSVLDDERFALPHRRLEALQMASGSIIQQRIADFRDLFLKVKPQRIN